MRFPFRFLRKDMGKAYDEKSKSTDMALIANRSVSIALFSRLDWRMVEHVSKHFQRVVKPIQNIFMKFVDFLFHKRQIY